MNEKVLKYLYDVKFAIDEIDSYFIDREKLFEDYTTNIIALSHKVCKLKSYSEIF